MKFFRKYFLYLLELSTKKNLRNIIDFLDKKESCNFLDLGCNDGVVTLNFAKKIETKNIYGVEIVDNAIAIAESNGIKVFKADLNLKLPFEDSYFYFITANQVIEHLNNTDNFISEIHRILKPGGYAIISTENLASWHNIFSLLLGFQPFSITNYSNKGVIGNPFSLWKQNKYDDNTLSWQHQKIFSYFGLKDLFIKNGFSVIAIKTSGYYPLPGFFSDIDKIHGHWLTIKVQKL